MNSNKTYKLHMDSVSYALKVPKSEIGCLIVRASHNVVEVTKRELVSKLAEGFSIIPGLCDMEGRKWYEGSLQKDFLSADFFGLDFDNGKYSKDEVIAKLEALGIPVFLVHDTYSSSDDCEKFHIIVCAKQTILEKDIRDKFQAVIMAPFVDGIDERCFNRNRYFNGTNKGIYYVNYEAEVDVFDAIERYWTGSDEQMQFIPRDSTLYKPTIATPKKKTAKVVVEKPQREKKVYELPGEEAYPDCTPTAGNGLYKYNMAKHYKEYMAFVEQNLETKEYVDGTGRKALIFDIFNEVSFAVSIRKAYKVCLEINDRFAEPLSVRDFNSCTWNAYRHIEEVCSDLHNTQFIYTYDRQLCRLGVDESSKAELTYYKNRENKEIADYLRPLKEERNSYIKNLREQGYGYKKIKKALVEKYGEIDAEFREKYEKPSELCLSISGIKKVLEKEGYTFGTIHSSNNIYIFSEPLADVQEEGLNAEQQEAYDLAIGGANIAILARGGCGKSYTLDWIANDMREAGRIVGRCAATGVAAQNIGGSTIHHMFGIIPDEEYSVSFNTVMNLLAYDCIQIDEIGMVDAETFSKVAYAINYIKRAYNHRIQLIVAGDPLQIVSVQGSYYFESPEYQTMGFTEVRLERNMRQANAEYDSLLASIRLGENRSYTVSALNHLCGLSENTEAMYAYAHKWRARQKNREKLSMLEGEAIQLDEKLTVKVGAKVVVTANGRADRHGIIRYYNGMQGVLKEVRRSSVVIETASGAAVVIKKQRIEVNEYESYEGYPLALGYAMTIHKLQGMTLDELNIHPSCFACGQLYTALSRVRTPEGVHLLRPVRPEYVKVNRAALDYVRSGRVREAV